MFIRHIVFPLQTVILPKNCEIVTVHVGLCFPKIAKSPGTKTNGHDQQILAVSVTTGIAANQAPAGGCNMEERLTTILVDRIQN